MNTTLIKRIAAATIGYALLALPAATQPAALLDGRVFLVDLGPKGKSADEKDDVVTFRDGRFHSRFCDKYSFGTGAYEAAAEGGAVVFATETSSDKEGRLVWKGRIESGAIEGVIVHYRKPSWFNPKPAPRELWFKGKAR